ncbi:MAG: NADH-quinone oxidoreductase subunit L, partial [Aestuariivirgaceae bacterium]
MNTLFLLIVFLPLIGALIAGLGGSLALKTIGGAADHRAHDHDDDHHHAYEGPRWPALLTTGLLLFCALLSWIAFYNVAIGGQQYKVEVATWVHSGGLAADWALRIDT